MSFLKIEENKTAPRSNFERFYNLGSQTDSPDLSAIETLTRTNELLVNEILKLQVELKILTIKYNENMEEDIKTKKIFSNEVKRLNGKIDEIIDARRIKFVLPKDWSVE